MTPEEYLRKKGYEPKKAPGEWLIRCPVCGDSRNLRHAHLYVNRDHGAWKCHRCGEHGSFADLQKLHGDEPEKASQSTHGRWQVYTAALSICQDTLLEYPHVLKYLTQRRALTPETIGKYRLGYMDSTFRTKMSKQGFSLADLREAGLVSENGNNPMFLNMIIIPYYNRESLVTLRGKKIDGGTLHARGVSLPMFGSDNVRTRDDDVFICEGEVDTMYLDQLGFNVAGIPGADTFKETWATWFDKARRVFIVLDADKPGRDGAEKIKQLLGTKARIIELPVPEEEDSTDLQEYFLRDGHSIEDFRELVDALRGRRLFTVGEALKERDELATLEGLKLGWTDLDHWLHPGLLPGQVMVVLAKTGVGKTAWLTQVIHNLSEYYVFDNGHVPTGPGVPILVLSLEQTKAEIVNRMERIAYFWDPWIDGSHFQMAHRNVRVNDENKIPPSDIRVLYNEFIEEVETPPRVIVLDYLGYWARTFTGGSRYEQVSDAIMELKAVAKEYGVSIIVPHQVSRGGKKGERLELDFARDSGFVEETADFAMSLWAPHSRDDGDPEKEISDLDRADVRLEILKSRHGGKGKETRMLWAPASLALAPAGDHRMRRLTLKEYEWIDEGLLYDGILRRHRGGIE